MSSVPIYNINISKNKEIHGIRRCVKALGWFYIWEGGSEVNYRKNVSDKQGYIYICMLRDANIYIDRKQVSNDGEE